LNSFLVEQQVDPELLALQEWASSEETRVESPFDVTEVNEELEKLSQFAQESIESETKDGSFTAESIAEMNKELEKLNCEQTPVDFETVLRECTALFSPTVQRQDADLVSTTVNAPESNAGSFDEIGEIDVTELSDEEKEEAEVSFWGRFFGNRFDERLFLYV
jgi:hypothetical protein